jgi:hypothetical protein
MELNISPNFTVEDIHKVREYNYERTKNMTFEEYKADLKKNADKARNRMQELKEKSNR